MQKRKNLAASTVFLSDKYTSGRLVPKLSPQENDRKKGEIINYHFRNVTGRENLSTCEWTNELAHTSLTEYNEKVSWLKEQD